MARPTESIGVGNKGAESFGLTGKFGAAAESIIGRQTDASNNPTPDVARAIAQYQLEDPPSE